MHRHARVICPVVLLAALGACAGSSNITAASTASLALAFSTTADLGASSSAPVKRFVVSSGADVLSITKAQVVLAKVELRGSAASGCAGESDDDHRQAECEALELRPALIDLPVDSSLLTSLDVAIPRGSYTALEAQVHVVSGGEEGGASFVAAHPDLSEASVRVEGSYNGAPFVYLGRPEAKLELEFSPPLTVASDAAQVTVHVDLASWFSDGRAGLLDPRTANRGGANESAVADHIARSFRAFEDDDHDGRDDHGHHERDGLSVSDRSRNSP